MKKSLISLLFIITSFQSMTQDKLLKGVVVSEKGVILPGVIVESAIDTTSTNLEGRFELSTTKDRALRFSMIGFETSQYFNIDEDQIRIVLKETYQKNDEEMLHHEKLVIIENKPFLVGTISNSLYQPITGVHIFLVDSIKTKKVGETDINGRFMIKLEESFGRVLYSKPATDLKYYGFSGAEFGKK